MRSPLLTLALAGVTALPWISAHAAAVAQDNVARDPAPQAAPQADVPADVVVDAAHTLRTFDPRQLGGTNVAMWYYPSLFASPTVRQWMTDLHAGSIRMPGGSWSNVVYWNGNGVRRPDGTVDPTKVGPDGYPAVDYSAYAPSFLADPKTLHPASGGWHGHTDVKKIHEFIQAIPGTQAMACPNIGTGRPIDAAEWVRWANQKMGYDVHLWELGNELGGAWEAGTELPFDKGRLTASMYTQRYNDTANAMRAVDPSIKIGGGAFAEEMVRDCGKNVDFVSIHTYPGSVTQTDAQMFADIGPGLKQQVTQARGWIQKYQPQRASQIQIAYTEWNLGFSVSKSEMFSGLWAEIFLGELAKQGVDMAQQWDCFADMLDVSDANAMARKPEYYALWLWNNYMGSRLISASKTQPGIYTYASRSDDAVTVMFVNTDASRSVKTHVRLDHFDPADIAEQATISSREYYWNPITQKPQWSTGPQIEKIAAGPRFEVELPPFSIRCIRVPSRSKPQLTPMAQEVLAAPAAPASAPALKVVMPSEIYVGDQLHADLIALAAGTDQPYRDDLADVALTVNGNARFSASSIRVDRAVWHFDLTANAPGDLTLTARSGASAVSQTLHVKPSIPRPIVFWDFGTPPVSDEKTFSSSYALTADSNERPNRNVARVDLNGQKAAGHDNANLLVVRELPPEAKLNKANIRGVIADVMVPKGFTTDDPNAHIMVVMQSSANWWMPLGTIPLKPGQDWKTYRFDITNPTYIKALPAALNIMFVLQSQKPVKGSVYFDKVGFMVR
ncbi:MAG: GH39 family glycosyl hydrolase [Tepidisphaeraceae bacterium]